MNHHVEDSKEQEETVKVENADDLFVEYPVEKWTWPICFKPDVKAGYLKISRKVK